MLSRMSRLCAPVLLALLFVASPAGAQTDTDSFITTWRVPANDTLRFPGTGSYSINWGDGTSPEQVSTTSATFHQYTSAGDYRITVSAGITRFHLNNRSDSDKLIDINQWGTASWTTMDGAFRGASNMQMSATDRPDLSAVSSMRSMFRDAHLFNGDIGNWNVAEVTNMGGMFNGADAFEQNLGPWYIQPDSIRISPGSEGGDNVLHTFTPQNAFLGGQNPAYSLLESEDGDDNDQFTLTSSGELRSTANVSTGTYNLRIAVNRLAGPTGLAIFGTGNVRAVSLVVQSNDSSLISLIALSLSDGTTPVPLTPAFASATTDYTAAVGSTVNRLTVTATTTSTAANATLSGTAADGTTELPVSGTLTSGALISGLTEGVMVTLDGSASSDPEDEGLTYAWSQTSGATVSLSDTAAESPTFTAPVQLLNTATLAFQLIVAVQGREGPANRNRLCVKGRFGYDYIKHPHRLTRPLIRRDDAPKRGDLDLDPANPLTHFREAEWDEALDFAAAGLKGIRDARGGAALAGFGSAKCSNEEAYLFQKLVRTGFGTNNVDHCTRLCHASSVAAT